ncbi:hypothetical protein EX30DRAFT_397980 [Ascodesmis nigricans]|uniref:Uncharacterized protein n=1 Tax=Ascodesmis nigricans TaxID=341454 RepID=A0A4S2MMH6_9PEZI|nr:hypothetical protein EX30DRAFT_397980 [Ascodesmis nigricans]
MAGYVLNILGGIFFTLRVLFFSHDILQLVLGRTGWWIINFANAVLALMASAISLGSFDGKDSRGTCPPVDGAFGGLGTRVGLWITVAFILVQWFIGAWSSLHIGSKAMAGGLLIGNVAILICLIVQHTSGQLSFTDIVIGSMVIDVQGSTLLNQLAMKETLASLWMVGSILIVGFASLIEIGILLGLAGKGELQQCKLFYFDSIQTGGPVPTLFWLYYTTRWLAYITTAMRAVRCLLDFYYYAEVTELQVDPCSYEGQVAASFPEIQSPSIKALIERRRKFFSYHGTVDYFGAENFVFAICVIFNFERSVNLVGHDSLDSFGQEMGLIIAIVSIFAAVFGALRAAEYPKRFWHGNPWGLGARTHVAQEMEKRLGKDMNGKPIEPEMTCEPKDISTTCSDTLETGETLMIAPPVWIPKPEVADVPLEKSVSEVS